VSSSSREGALGEEETAGSMECIGCAGTDHVDLQAAIDHGITVAEVAYCKSISVAEHVVMSILGLVRNYIPSYEGS
jgi:lactate dehydrogenase-like 2-hydroxyacid dehydrogenase